MARRPSALWTSIAKGPRSRHSPLSGFAGSSRFEEIAAATPMLEATEESGLGMLTPMAAIVATSSVVVGEASWVRVGSKPGEGSMAISAQRNIRGVLRVIER